MFNYDETMLAASLRRNKVIVALYQRVFRTKHKKPHHYTLGAICNPLGHGPPLLIVIPTFSGAGELCMGQDAFVRESRSGWCTGPIFAAFAHHFCGWLTGYRAGMGVAPNAEAALIVDNAQLHAYPGALRVFRANHVRVIIAASPLHSFAATCGCCMGEAFQGPLLHFSALADG
jgi:hypothetical protein